MTQQLVTASDVARELDLTVQTSQKRLEGLDHVLMVGRSKVYDLSAVREHIWSQNVALLAFLGLPETPEASYDVLVDQEDSASA